MNSVLALNELFLILQLPTLLVPETGREALQSALTSAIDTQAENEKNPHDYNS